MEPGNLKIGWRIFAAFAESVTGSKKQNVNHDIFLETLASVVYSSGL
jgi:hypothetical protein